MPTPPSNPDRVRVVRLTDFDPNAFYYAGGLIKLVGGGSGGGGALNAYKAGAVISGDKALMFQPDGTVIHADPTSPTYVYAGIALSAAQPGGSVSVIDEGPFAASQWAWTFGLPIFVAPDGNLTQVPPETGFSHIIGRATGATTVRLLAEDLIATGE